MVTGLEIIASRPVSKSESDGKATNEREDRGETDYPLKNILREENHNEPDIKTVRQNRSRT